MTDQIMTAETYLTAAEESRDGMRIDSPAAYHAWLMADDGRRCRIRGIDPASVQGPESATDEIVIAHPAVMAERGIPAVAARTERVAVAPAVARIYEGSWIADCPDACGGAMFVRPDWPFMCGECFNATVGRRYRLTVFPAVRDKFERELLKRPNPASRNWFPAETVDDLIAENIEHGHRRA